MNIAQELERYILAELAEPGLQSLDPEDDLLSKNIIDSLGIIQIMSFIEEKFAIAIGPDEVVPENFRSVSSLAQFIEGKLAEG